MSFDIFFAVMQNGEPAGIPAVDVFEAFGKSCEWEKERRAISDKFYYTWEYGRRDWGTIWISSFGDDETQIEHMSINRPGNDPELWMVLFVLMKKYPLCMYFPCEEFHCVLADESYYKHFEGTPFDEASPVFVSNPEELLRSIQGGQAAADAYRDHVLKSTGSQPLS